MQLSKAIDICKAAEASEQQLHTLAEEKNDRKRDSRHKDWKQDNQETRGNKHKRQTPDNKSFRRNCGRSPPPPPPPHGNVELMENRVTLVISLITLQSAADQNHQK